MRYFHRILNAIFLFLVIFHIKIIFEVTQALFHKFIDAVDNVIDVVIT